METIKTQKVDDSPLVSYLVACYNHENFIYQCLKSVKDDICCPAEVIVIDDGSTDGSKKVIEQWINENPQIHARLIARENRGVSKTLNELFSLAKGDFFRTVSSDDAVIPGTTKALIEKLKAKPGKSVIFGDVKTIDTNGDVICDSHMKSLGVDRKSYVGDVTRAIISKWAVCGPAWVLRRDFQKFVGKFDESLIIEDWNMYLRLCSVQRIEFYDGAVALYRVHDKNTSRTTDVRKRIVNLESQMRAGISNYPGFNGPYLWALRGQVDLLKAKISFLKRNFFKMTIYLCKFVYFWTVSEMTFLFRSLK